MPTASRLTPLSTTPSPQTSLGVLLLAADLSGLAAERLGQPPVLREW